MNTKKVGEVLARHIHRQIHSPGRWARMAEILTKVDENAEHAHALDTVRKAIAKGPTRVLINDHGAAVPPRQYFESMKHEYYNNLGKPRHWFIRADGWSLASPAGLRGTAGDMYGKRSEKYQREFGWIAELVLDGDKWTPAWISTGESWQDHENRHFYEAPF